MSFEAVLDGKKKTGYTSVPARSLPMPRSFDFPGAAGSEQASAPAGHDFGQLPVEAQPRAAGNCPLFLASPRACPFGGACHACPARVRAKLVVGDPDDDYEREANRMAEKVTRTPARNPGRDTSIRGSITPLVHEVLGTPGQSLDAETRASMETNFGCDVSHVHAHTDAKAAQSAKTLHALAYTVGRDMVFGKGQYKPETLAGRKLLVHELMHVAQQGGIGNDQNRLLGLSPLAQPHIQRTLGDGHDLSSPRFSRLPDLEAAYDEEKVIKKGDSSRGVQAVQQALYDLGFFPASPAIKYGADGKFGDETKTAVKAFQRANPPLAEDGEVGDETMEKLDARFATAPAIPAPAVRSAPWTIPCVRSILCPWSPHTVDILKTRINLKSFDSVVYADEKWDGTAWIPNPWVAGGYNTGTEIGVVNDTCEDMSETLYHEVLHAEQPSTHDTTKRRESYAYRIGEEFSIVMGLMGRSAFRSTDVRGRQFADPSKIEAALSPGGAASYPGVPSSSGDREILGKAATFGHVRVQRNDGSIYTRPANVDESIPGPPTLVHERTHRRTDWTCP